MHPALRDEVLVQLTKQLNCNPTPNSVDRGWVLLELALSTFPPSEDLENYLEVWLRDRHATPCVRAMHKSIFEGPKAEVPTLAEIEAFVTSVRGDSLAEAGSAPPHTAPHHLAHPPHRLPAPPPCPLPRPASRSSCGCTTPTRASCRRTTTWSCPRTSPR